RRIAAGLSRPRLPGPAGSRAVAGGAEDGQGLLHPRPGRRGDRFGIAQRPGGGGLRHSGRAGDLRQPHMPVLRRRLPAGHLALAFAHRLAAVVEVRAMSRGRNPGGTVGSPVVEMRRVVSVAATSAFDSPSMSRPSTVAGGPVNFIVGESPKPTIDMSRGTCR